MPPLLPRHLVFSAAGQFLSGLVLRDLAVAVLQGSVLRWVQARAGRCTRRAPFPLGRADRVVHGLVSRAVHGQDSVRDRAVRQEHFRLRVKLQRASGQLTGRASGVVINATRR